MFRLVDKPVTSTFQKSNNKLTTSNDCTNCLLFSHMSFGTCMTFFHGAKKELTTSVKWNFHWTITSVSVCSSDKWCGVILNCALTVWSNINYLRLWELHRRKSCVQVCNNIRVSNYWQNYNFWLSYPINKQMLFIHANSCQYTKNKTTGTQKNQWNIRKKP